MAHDIGAAWHLSKRRLYRRWARTLRLLRNLIDPVGAALALAFAVGSLATYIYVAQEPADLESTWLVATALGLIGITLISVRFSWQSLLLMSTPLLLGAGASLARVGLEGAQAELLESNRGIASELFLDIDHAEVQRTASPVNLEAPEGDLIGEATRRVTELCQAAGGTIAEVVGRNQCRETRSKTSTVDIATGRFERNLALKVAEAQLAVTRALLAAADEDSKDALEEAVTTRAEAADSALASLDDPTPGVGLVQALTEGANVITTRLFATDNARSLDLDPLGWSLLLLTLLGFVRVLAIRNGERGLGPVIVRSVESSGTPDAVILEQFRSDLLRNIPEPGSVPGANTLAEVSNLVGAIEIPIAKSLIAKAIKAVAGVAAPERGYIVEYADLETKSEDSPSSQESVVVRVRHARTTRLLGQKIAGGGTKQAAHKTAAYWAAATIIEAARTVPAWAKWNTESAESLAVYSESENDDSTVDGIDSLRRAFGKAQQSGVLGLRLAHAEALDGNQLASFALAAQVARSHPGYQIARYRLAVSASLLAACVESLEDEAGEVTIENLKSDLRALGAGALPDAIDFQVRGHLDRAGSRVTKPESFESARRRTADELCQFGFNQLKRARRRMWMAWVLLRLLQSDYRAEYVQYLWFRRRRREMKLVGTSCRLLISARRITVSGDPTALIGTPRQAATGDPMATTPPLNAEALCRKAEAFQARSMSRLPTWQVAYNLACFWAVAALLADRTARESRCMQLLEVARRSPGSNQMSAKWLTKDPDLATVADRMWFKEIVHKLEDRGE